VELLVSVTVVEDESLLESVDDVSVTVDGEESLLVSVEDV